MEKDNPNPSLTGTVGVGQIVPAGAVGRGAVLNQASTSNNQQGVALMNQGVRSGIDALETVQVRMDQQKTVWKSKLPADIPAATALARIYQAVGSALQNKTTVDQQSHHTVAIIVPAGAVGCGAFLNRDSTGNNQQGVALMNQGISSGIDALETMQVRMDQQKIVWKSKLPADIPAATALARIYQAVGSALQNKTTVDRIGAQGEGATVYVTDGEAAILLATGKSSEPVPVNIAALEVKSNTLNNAHVEAEKFFNFKEIG
ncbi:hypothetical protein A4A49_25508 [Nicotiana attenuata]|uniref:Uncharacterized protein n=1 Tax=Nicotiana attenuata TaxID=49451 RepID=A0A1J6IYA1_NICAT|nr:hypothetical protein A4A49_25508 [Nicotiana attenuata]